jgi:hypothetical protein
VQVCGAGYDIDLLLPIWKDGLQLNGTPWYNQSNHSVLAIHIAEWLRTADWWGFWHRRCLMPELTVELTWREWEFLEAVAESEEISPEEVVRRALDIYLAEERIRLSQQQDSTVVATRDHMVGPDEVMDLDL